MTETSGPTLGTEYSLLGLTEPVWAARLAREAEEAHAAAQPPRISVVHTRDPDTACSLKVFLDGQRVEADVEDIDPGHGYPSSCWTERLTAAEDSHAHAPTEHTAAVLAALRSQADSEHLYAEAHHSEGETMR